MLHAGAVKGLTVLPLIETLTVKKQSNDKAESINQSAPSLQPFLRPAPIPSTAPSEEKRPEDGGDVRQHDETEDDNDEGDAQPSSGLSGGPMVRGALLPSACGGQGAPVQDQLVMELLRHHLHFLLGQVQLGGQGSLAAAARAVQWPETSGCSSGYGWRIRVSLWCQFWDWEKTQILRFLCLSCVIC